MRGGEGGWQIEAIVVQELYYPNAGYGPSRSGLVCFHGAGLKSSADPSIGLLPVVPAAMRTFPLDSNVAAW